MIDRYTKAEMGAVWSQQNKFQKMLDVEVAVAEAQAHYGMIPKQAAVDIKNKSKFNIKQIEKIEKITRHDVIAFVTNVAKNVGPNGRYVHYAMTSSDVIDTALSLQIKDASALILLELKSVRKSLLKQIKKHSETLCTGRTHGMHAEPTTFGMKLCGYLMELDRNLERFNKASEQMSIAKLSGAVGTYSSQGPEVEARVAKKLKLIPEDIATQVIPRDRHAELILSLALIGAFLERLSVEFRHLQRTEVNEVSEGFTKGQKGSSAMPHKKNPISSENLTGAARMLRSYTVATMENIALWHERDISHSSVERVFIADAFILCHYSLNRMAGVIDHIVVNKQQMLRNMNLSKGQLFSSHVLLELVRCGLSREEAYSHVQRVAHSLGENDTMYDNLLKDKIVNKYLDKSTLDKIFSGKTHLASIKKIISKTIKKER